MIRTNNEFAIQTAVELAKLNIQQCSNWIEADDIIEFVDKIYDALTGRAESPAKSS